MEKMAYQTSPIVVDQSFGDLINLNNPTTTTTSSSKDVASRNVCFSYQQYMTTKGQYLDVSFSSFSQLVKFHCDDHDKTLLSLKSFRLVRKSQLDESFLKRR